MIAEDRNDGRLTLVSRYTGGGEIIESKKARRAREEAEARGTSTTGASETPGSDPLASAGTPGVTFGGTGIAGATAINPPVAPAGTIGTTR